jgi:hypothetical protein
MAEKEPDHEIQQFFRRQNELVAAGMERLYASGLAELEMRLSQWPSAWGDDFHVLLYGDFLAPAAVQAFPDLGITVLPEKRTNTVIRSALCVLEAIVTLPDKSLDSVVDASRRIGLLLGAWSLVNWSHGGIAWWSYITHGSIAGATGEFDRNYEDIVLAVEKLRAFEEPVRRKVEAALFWIREPHASVLDGYRLFVMRRYSAMWNALECLVGAICLAIPPQKMSPSAKASSIKTALSAGNGKLSPGDIEHLYHAIVNPGFVGKAEHAFTCAYPDEAERMAMECFRRTDKVNRLYNIRNAINHGEIDAENVLELARVSSRYHVLWVIVWRLFGRLLPVKVPGGSLTSIIDIA